MLRDEPHDPAITQCVVAEVGKLKLSKPTSASVQIEPADPADAEQLSADREATDTLAHARRRRAVAARGDGARARGDRGGRRRRAAGAGRAGRGPRPPAEPLPRGDPARDRAPRRRPARRWWCGSAPAPARATARSTSSITWSSESAAGAVRDRAGRVPRSLRSGARVRGARSPRPAGARPGDEGLARRGDRVADVAARRDRRRGRAALPTRAARCRIDRQPCGHRACRRSPVMPPSPICFARFRRARTQSEAVADLSHVATRGASRGRERKPALEPDHPVGASSA